MNPKAANKAIDLLGGPAKAAPRLDRYRPEGSPQLTAAAVFMWRKRGIPLLYCIAVEKELGGALRCEDLRPDVDWAYLRNTKPKKRRAA